VAVAVVAAAGGAVAFEEDGSSFQKPEELTGSVWTTSLLLSGDATAAKEEIEDERVSQVARLLGADFSVSVSVLFSVFLFSDWGLSVVGLLSPTVALRMGEGFFFSVCFISAGSSKTSSFSRPIIHHDPEDLV